MFFSVAIQYVRNLFSIYYTSALKFVLYVYSYTCMYLFVFLGIDLGVAHGIGSLGRPVAILIHCKALVFVF
jgi:hypothetical protein